MTATMLALLTHPAIQGVVYTMLLIGAAVAVLGVVVICRARRVSRLVDELLDDVYAEDVYAEDTGPDGPVGGGPIEGFHCEDCDPPGPAETPRQAEQRAATARALPTPDQLPPCGRLGCPCALPKRRMYPRFDDIIRASWQETGDA